MTITRLGTKPRSIGLIVFLNNMGYHPELGRDFYGTREEYDFCLAWQKKLEPIEDEM